MDLGVQVLNPGPKGRQPEHVDRFGRRIGQAAGVHGLISVGGRETPESKRGIKSGPIVKRVSSGRRWGARRGWNVIHVLEGRPYPGLKRIGLVRYMKAD